MNRKFHLPILQRGEYTEIKEYSPQPTTDVNGMINSMIPLMEANGLKIKDSGFKAFAFKQRRWLSSDETISTLPGKETTIAIISHELIESLGKETDIFAELIELMYPGASVNIQKANELIMAIADDNDTEVSLLEKMNKILMVQPNIAGIGINFNEIIANFIKNRK